MRKVLKAFLQVGLLWGVYWLGKQFVSITGLPIPGNVVGIILLFGLLSLGVVKIEYLQEATDFLMKHLLFFFIPITLGLINWGSVFYHYGVVLVLAIVFSSLLSLWTVGYLTQYLIGRKHKCNSR